MARSMRLHLAVSLALIACSGAVSPGLAFGQAADDISFKVDKERSRGNKITLAVIGGAAAVFTGVGAIFTFDSQSKAEKVNSGGLHTGLVWTAEREDTRKSAIRSRNIAIVNYSIGGALALATVVYYMATDPGQETVVYHSRRPTVTPVVSTQQGGAVFGARWSWR